MVECHLSSHFLRPFFGCARAADFLILAAFFRAFSDVADSASSASISSTVGKTDFRLGGNARVSSYSEIPMGLLTPRRAYSAMMWLRSWHRIRDPEEERCQDPIRLCLGE
jgi:hypothetical protein